MAIANELHRMTHEQSGNVHARLRRRARAARAAISAREKWKRLQGNAIFTAHFRPLSTMQAARKHAENNAQKNAKAFALASRLAGLLRQAPMNEERSMPTARRDQRTGCRRVAKDAAAPDGAPLSEQRPRKPYGRSSAICAFSRTCIRQCSIQSRPDRRFPGSHQSPTNGSHVSALPPSAG